MDQLLSLKRALLMFKINEIWPRSPAAKIVIKVKDYLKCH